MALYFSPYFHVKTNDKIKLNFGRNYNLKIHQKLNI